MEEVQAITTQQMIPPKKKLIYLYFQSLNPEQINQMLHETSDETQKIQLISNQLTFEGLRHFQRRDFSSLQTLMLFDNSIGDKGCKLIASLAIPKVTEIGLGKNQVTSSGCCHISKANWKELTKLELQQNKMASASMRFLQGAQNPINQAEMKRFLLFQTSQLQVFSMRNCPERRLLSRYIESKFARMNPRNYYQR